MTSLPSTNRRQVAPHACAMCRRPWTIAGSTLVEAMMACGHGNVTITGSSFDNENGLAAYLTVNGVTPADGSARSFYVSGSGTFVGVVNAPAYALTIWGSGDFMGALIMLSANLGGSAGYHYDEALGTVTGGNGLGYKVASWIEDIQ